MFLAQHADHWDERLTPSAHTTGELRDLLENTDYEAVVAPVCDAGVGPEGGNYVQFRTWFTDKGGNRTGWKGLIEANRPTVMSNISGFLFDMAIRSMSGSSLSCSTWMAEKLP